MRRMAIGNDKVKERTAENKREGERERERTRENEREGEKERKRTEVRQRKQQRTDRVQRGTETMH